MRSSAVDRRRSGRPFSALRRLRLREVLGFVLLVASAACATPDPVAVQQFRQGLLMATQQTTTVLSSVNEMLAEQQLEYAVESPKLTETLFEAALPAEGRDQWARTFHLLDEYAAQVETATGGASARGLQAELSQLGWKLSAQFAEPLPPGVAVGASRLGGAITTFRLRQNALAILQQADPAVQEIFEAMMREVGHHPREGIRLTVWSSWTTQLAELKRAYLSAADLAEKRRIAERFVGTVKARAANDRALESLQLSYRSLAAAHAQLALGRSVDAVAFLGCVRDESNAISEELARWRQQSAAPGRASEGARQ